MKKNYFKVKNSVIGKPGNTFIIAEIGINHDGNFNKCKKLIFEAFKAGANAVKLQTIDIDQSYDKKTKSYKEFLGKNFSDLELKKLKNYAESKKIIFFSTPGDFKSFRRLKNLKIPLIKISSGLANNYPLIKIATRKKIPLIISTGFADEKDINRLSKFLASKI